MAQENFMAEIKMKSSFAHIVLLCSRLDLPGGIERAVVNTANLFSRHGHRVTLVVLDETDKSFYPIDATIELVQHPLSFGITPDGNIISRKIKLLTDVLKLRRLLKSLTPGLVIATEYPFAAAAVLAGARQHTKVISWEHHHYYELKRNLFWNNVFRFTYPRLDAVVCLNEDERKLFATINANPLVIPNFIGARTTTAHTQKEILTVARLTAVKGIDYLLTAAAWVLKKHPDWTWTLIGDGEMKEQVTTFIEQEELQQQLLLLPPVTHHIQHYYDQASLYVMTSRHECFPMTLLEAQASGLPCISFDCDTGPRHIITPDTGVLVEKENPQALAAELLQLITDEERRKKMGENAIAAMQRFSPETIYQYWKELVMTNS